LVISSRTYTLAEALLVATTAIILAPAAIWIGNFRIKTSKGTMMTPPPNPKRAPKNPEKSATDKAVKINVGVMMHLDIY
jgi:hypothetical protein